MSGNAHRDRAIAERPLEPESRTVVAVWNELTPYRLHVMRRTRDELPGVRVVNVFTHSVSENSMPWSMEAETDLGIVFDRELRVPGTGKFLHRHALALARRIRGIVARERPVFVLMHGHNNATRLILLHMLRRMRVPMVHASDANVFDESAAATPRTLARRLYLRHVLHRMSGYMPMGTAGRAFYRLHGRRDLPSFAFPYEPDYAAIRSVTEEAAEAFRRRHGLTRERRRFLYSGRLVEVKRVGSLIEAFVQVADRLPEWDLVIAGDGPLRGTLASVVPERLRPRVRFLGFLQMDEVRCAYRSADVLVHPSATEPWGLVINEAVAAGLPVIATDVTGAAVDLVRHGVNGVLVSPDSVPELVLAMASLDDRERLASMAAASSRVLADWVTTADPIDGMRAAVTHFSKP